MSDEHIGPCGKYCAVVDECDARGHEITRLRADLAAVTAERDRMREALKPFADAADDFIAEKHDAHRAIVTLGDLRRARAAIEGVTEPAKGDSNA